jgi:hypothetical protein
MDTDRESILTLNGVPASHPGASSYTLGAFAGSQLTLVGPRPDAHAVLVYSSDSNFNSTIYHLNQPVYRFKSNKTGTKTDLIRVGSNGEEQLMVTYDRGLIGSVLVRPDGEKLKVSKYLRPVKTKPEG